MQPIPSTPTPIEFGPAITRESLLLSARLQRLPTTRYTCAVVLLLAGALSIEAFDIGSLSVILPILKPLMDLSAVQVGLLAAASSVGLTIGMIPAGLLADRFGRKRLLIGGMLWFVGLTLVSALAPDFWTLLLLRGLSGLGMAPTFIVPYALVSELVSSRSRAVFAGVLEASLGIGYVAVPSLGLVVLTSLPPEIAWRVFLLIAGLPIVYVWVLWKYLPESPRWLSRTGRSDEAERIVAAIEERVERLTGAPLPEPVVTRELETSFSGERQRVGFRAVLEVWQPPYLVRTLAMTSGAFGTFALFYVAVNYIPSLFAATSIGLSNAFILSLIVTSSQIPGKLLNGALSDFLGRKLTYALVRFSRIGWCLLLRPVVRPDRDDGMGLPVPVRGVRLGPIVQDVVHGAVPDADPSHWPVDLRRDRWPAARRGVVDSGLSGAGRGVRHRHHDDAHRGRRRGHLVCGHCFCPGNRRPFRRRT